MITIISHWMSTAKWRPLAMTFSRPLGVGTQWMTTRSASRIQIQARLLHVLLQSNVVAWFTQLRSCLALQFSLLYIRLEAHSWCSLWRYVTHGDDMLAFELLFSTGHESVASLNAASHRRRNETQWYAINGRKEWNLFESFNCQPVQFSIQHTVRDHRWDACIRSILLLNVALQLWQSCMICSDRHAIKQQNPEVYNKWHQTYSSAVLSSTWVTCEFYLFLSHIT